MSLTFSALIVALNGQPLLTDASEQLRSEADPLNHGIFLVAEAPAPQSRHVFTAGRLPDLSKFTLLHRYEPYWMKPATGDRVSKVPHETQFFLAEIRKNQWLLLVPLVDGPFRFALRGAPDETLQLVAETGDARTVGLGGVGLYAAAGPDPFALLEKGAQSVMHRMKSGRLRRDKPTPDFVDYFGWCTWDAFYHDVSADKVRLGLEHFRQGGVSPKLLILDDGWQMTARAPTGETRLTGLDPNEKFNGDLSATVRLAKEDFGVELFMVWHAVIGYWGGVDGSKLPAYGVVDQARHFNEGLHTYHPGVDHEWWGSLVGLVPPAQIAEFYHDYHRRLRQQGVDGVKVDTQAMLEALAQNQGGRVALSRAYREALEGSVQTHFEGRLINCMSHAQEAWYFSPASTVIRSSTDFWPKKPETHGLHLYTNSQVGLWFGEFMLPDWDMFQSGHEWGAYHAAGRALSGGPVYVSDKPGQHDFALLRKLVCADGTVLRCDLPGRPTLDTLCVDPTAEDVALKIWNRAGPAGILGVFNGGYAAEPAKRRRLSATASPADVPGLPGSRFAAYAHQERRLTVIPRNEQLATAVDQNGFEIFSFVPVEAGFAAVGLVDKFASPAAIAEMTWRGPDNCLLHLSDGGEFLAWSERRPASVLVDGHTVQFTHDETGALRIHLANPGRQQIELRW